MGQRLPAKRDGANFSAASRAFWAIGLKNPKKGMRFSR